MAGAYATYQYLKNPEQAKNTAQEVVSSIQEKFTHKTRCQARREARREVLFAKGRAGTGKRSFNKPRRRSICK